MLKAKRALAILLAVLLAWGGTWVGTIDASAETSGIYTYEVTGGNATITDCDTSATGVIAIPASLGGYPVTSIGDWAFSYCTKLTSVTIPKSVTSIGYDAFSDCDNLATINVDESNPNFSSVDGVLYNKNQTTLIQCPAAKASINIVSSVTVIKAYAFSECKNLTVISIPNGVTQLEPTLFISCTSLVTINIPASVTNINSALNGCSSLLAINVDASNSNYSSFDGVLYDKNQTNLITIPCAATSVNIPSTTKSIDFYAFSNCVKLTAITVDVINLNYSNADGILYNKDKTTLVKCPATKASVTIPSSVSFIGKSAFEDNVSLTSITIPGTVSIIGDYAFESCSKLAKVTILNGVTSIGDWAFSFNSKLTAVVIPDSVTYIGDSAFSTFYDTTIYGNEGSYAQTFALAKGFAFVVGDLPRNTYAVTFNANGGSGAPTAQTKTEGLTLDLNSTRPSRTGYTFAGWATNSTAVIAQYQPGDSYTTDAALSLYAVWQVNTYTVRYNANGGSGTMADSSYTYGVAKALNANAFTKADGYFSGWATSAGGVVVYINSQSVSNLTVVNGAIIELYAVWKTADKNALNAKINTIKDTQKGNYTDVSWDAFQTALNGAQTIAGNATVTQEQVDNALNALNAAHNGLTEKKGVFGTNPKWYGAWWHYILFFIGFGFIWMWF